MGKALKFMQASLLLDTDECIMWPFSRLRDGYPCMHRGGKTRTTANIVCELSKGPPPTPDHEAAHSCGRGRHGCINHKHIRWATKQENSDDRSVHGTDNRGDQSPKSVLSKEQVIAIRSEIGTCASVGRRYGVSPSTISRIRTRDTWNMEGI